MEKVNLYLVHNETNRIGGNFYNVYVSSRDDLEYNPSMSISEYEEYCYSVDENFKKAGGIILKQDEYIDDTKIYSDVNTDEVEYALTINDIDAEILSLYYQKDILFKEYLKQVVELDYKIRTLYKEREEVEVGYQKKLGM